MLQEDRKNFIGGSEIAAIMGLSRWGTPLSVWASKTGYVPDKDLSDVEAVQLGVELEDFVARKFQKASGFKIRNDNRHFIHPDYPYMGAHIDRWIVGEDALLECKTASAWKLKEWDGQEIPIEYVLQVQWYLGILGKSRGYIAVLIGGQKFIWKMIEFSPELFQREVDAAKKFWEDFVQKKIAPIAMADDSELLSRMFPEGISEEIALNDEEKNIIDDLIGQRQGGVEQKKLVEDELEKIDNQIKQRLGAAELCQTYQYRVTWKNQTRSSIDTAKLKEDGLFDQYSRTNSFRVLRTTKLKS